MNRKQVCLSKFARLAGVAAFIGNLLTGCQSSDAPNQTVVREIVADPNASSSKQNIPSASQSTTDSVKNKPADLTPGADGYYTAQQTQYLTEHPPKPNNPIKDTERAGAYPLLSNPSGFVDTFLPKNYGEWQEVKLDPSTGAICGNGTAYKFYINREADNNNLMVYFEPGGACWDYASCTGGARGAANPKGIRQDYSEEPRVKFMSPLLMRNHPLEKVEPQNWTKVFIPYCTGDEHIGDRTVYYDDPEGKNPPLKWHHKGLRNVQAVIAWMRDNLPKPTRLLNTGCSAGGTGSMVSYHFVRSELNPDKGYLLNDSGPIFPASQVAGGNWKSLPLHQTVRESWGLDTVMETIDAESANGFALNKDNLATIYQALAEEFPHDRMALTHFMQDFNFSLYSYERFYDEIEHAETPALHRARVLEFWEEDTLNLANYLDEFDNWAYYFPNYREVNDSHCATIVDFWGTEIQAEAMDLGNFIHQLIDDNAPLESHIELDATLDESQAPNPVWAILDDEELLKKIASGEIDVEKLLASLGIQL